MFLGVEIGGTKLQLGVGTGEGTLRGLWRGRVDLAGGPAGIRAQIQLAVPEACQSAGVPLSAIDAVGIGFGGPIDDRRRRVITSHQVSGWNDFPLAAWFEESFAVPATLGNDADCAGLAEAHHGAGKGYNPVFYITIGSGIGGGLVVDGRVQRGVGLGAGEIGHLRLPVAGGLSTLEQLASGWAIEHRAGASLPALAERWRAGEPAAHALLMDAWTHLAEAICHVVALACPARIIIGGGVSLVGEEVLFEPLRALVAQRVFRPFAQCYDIVPAAMGEEVVVHGALLLARQFSDMSGERR